MHQKRERSRSPIHRSRSRSPREWKRAERRGGEMFHRENNIRLYVSNLPYEMRWQNIKDLFKEKVGNDVLFATLYEEPNGKSSGAATVEMRTKESAEQAINIMDKLEVNGRKIIVREEKEKDRRRHMPFIDEQNDRGRGNGDIQMNQGGPRNFSLELLQELNIDLKFITSQVFVANLDYKVTKAKLEEVFRIAGNVVDAELKSDKDGKSRGMGIVRFEHPMEAVQAICLFHCQYLYDRQIWVRMDRWIDPIIQDIPKRLPNGLRDLGIGLGMGGQPLLNIGEISNTWILGMLSGKLTNPQMNVMNPMTPMGNPMGGFGLGGIGGGAVNNMALLQNQLLGQNNIAALLAALGQVGGLGNAGINMGGAGGSSMKQIANMQQTNPNNIMGQQPPMNIDNFQQQGLLAQPPNQGNNNMARTDQFDNGGFSGGFDRSGAQYGTSGSGQKSQGGENTSIFVKNLPMHFGTQDIYNKFQICGDIQFVDLKKDQMGRSRGCAAITYYNSEAARKTINMMNGARLDNYTLEVRPDRLA